MDITIKPLTPDLYPDYLDFFDNRAFSDDNPNGPCYCTSPTQSAEEITRMISEFQANGVKETVRRHAVQLLNEQRIQGYLAFDGGTAIGWCNAADICHYTGFVPDFARACALEKTIAIVCFEIAPAYRRMGIASLLIDRVCADAKARGYQAVEGYAHTSASYNPFDYHGPLRLFEKAGFLPAAQQNGQIIMRKQLL